MSESEPGSSPIVWGDDDVPRSRLYGDVYFSASDGLAESRAVFLAGCGLPQAWSGRRWFQVAELGFGAGLNVAALLDLWRTHREAGAHLSIFSVEAHPLDASEAWRILGRWPEIADIGALLTSRWPGMARGFHRLDLPELCATLDVAIGPADEALSRWTGAANAWFLDGFAPARNPEMWRPALLESVARRSAPGARVATYTVAGQVRRDLAAAGFSVETKPGFGAKRHRLEARMPGSASDQASGIRVAVVGAGIAGAALAHAFAGLGIGVRVFDRAGPGSGASAGPAALVSPRLDAGLGPAAELFAQALRRASVLYGRIPGAILARGAIQLEVGAKDPRRYEAIAASGLFEPGDLRRLSARETSQCLREDTPPGLLIDSASVVKPKCLLAAWLGDVVRAEVVKVAQTSEGSWSLLGPGDREVAEADVVCLAAGMACSSLATGLPLTAVRGQASVVADVAWPMATLFGGYAIPTSEGLMFGATHDRGDEGVDIRAADNARNLEVLSETLPKLAERLRAAPSLSAHAAIRATTTDYLPLAGAAPGAPGGLFVLTGLGSRGFTLAPILAEHVAALALGQTSPLPARVAALVDPGRFARRARRRLGGDRPAGYDRGTGAIEA